MTAELEVPNPRDYGLVPACVVSAQFDGTDAVFVCYSTTMHGEARFVDGERETHEVRHRSPERFAKIRAERERKAGR